MHAHMTVPVHFLTEFSVAVQTGKGTLAAVHPHVHDELASYCKLLCTHGTVEVFVLQVHRSDVILQVLGAFEFFSAVKTLAAAKRRENRPLRRNP